MRDPRSVLLFVTNTLRRSLLENITLAKISFNLKSFKLNSNADYCIKISNSNEKLD